MAPESLYSAGRLDSRVHFYQGVKRWQCSLPGTTTGTISPLSPTITLLSIYLRVSPITHYQRYVCLCPPHHPPPSIYWAFILPHIIVLYSACIQNVTEQPASSISLLLIWLGGNYVNLPGRINYTPKNLKAKKKRRYAVGLKVKNEKAIAGRTRFDSTDTQMLRSLVPPASSRYRDAEFGEQNLDLMHWLVRMKSAAALRRFWGEQAVEECDILYCCI